MYTDLMSFCFVRFEPGSHHDSYILIIRVCPCIDTSFLSFVFSELRDCRKKVSANVNFDPS